MPHRRRTRSPLTARLVSLARGCARFDSRAYLVAGFFVAGFAACLGAGALAACGGAAKKANYAPATPEQLRVFEHGVDFVAALEGIEGRWREDWDRELSERVGAADFIGVVRIETLLTETDPEQVVTHRLVGRVTRTIAGEADKTLELRVREGESGFPTVHDNVTRIQAREFVAYVKWYRDDNGERAAHFHLSPNSEPVVSETEKVVGLRKESASEDAEGGRTTVYTH
jgi:hypothetical protein